MALGANLTSLLLFVRDMGERYRREMLAHGGAKEPMLMVEGNSNPLFNVPAITLQRFLSDKSDRSLLLFHKWTQLRFPSL